MFVCSRSVSDVIKSNSYWAPPIEEVSRPPPELVGGDDRTSSRTTTNGPSLCIVDMSLGHFVDDKYLPTWKIF
jgi:hypothetical protein